MNNSHEYNDEEDNDLDSTASYQRRKTPRLFPSYRLFVALMTSMAMFLGYALLTDFSVAIVKMTYQEPPKDMNETSSCIVLFDNKTNSSNGLHEGEFHWSSKVQGTMLSSYYYGYAIGQVPSGVLAAKFGGKTIFGISMILSGLATLLTHPAAIVTSSVWPLITIRVFIGLSASANYPCAMAIMGQYSYAEENTLLVSLATAGAKIAPVVSQIVSGYLADFSLLGGWPLVFYFWGGVCLLFVPFWVFGVKERPDDMMDLDNPLGLSVNKKELSLSIDFNKKIPWRYIMTDINIWSCCVLMICTDFMYTLLLTIVPSYLTYVLGFDVYRSGIYSALPHVFCTVLSMLCSYFTDLARQKLSIRTIIIRKLFVLIGGVTAGLFCFGIRFVPCNATWAIIFLSMGSIANAFFITQVCSQVLDICPNKDYVGAVFSWVNLFGIICSFIAPHVSELITSDNPYSYETWQRVFDLCGGINVAGALVFAIFASSKMVPIHAGYEPLN